MLKKTHLWACLGICLGTLTISPPADAKKLPLTVRIATPFPAGHILSDTALHFKEILESKSHGKIVVEVASSVLNEQTINPQMTSCDPTQRVADIMLTGGQPLQDWAPEYFFFNGPYVIEDYDHFQRVWEGPLGEEARELMNQNSNLVALGTVYRGFRQFTSNKLINEPIDFVNLKLRLPPTPDWVAVWSSLGVTPVQIPLTGIYAALANGTAEASEGDLTQISSLHLNEVQSHLTLTNHLVGFGLVLANECFMDQIKKDQKRKIVRAMRKAVKWGTTEMKARETALLSSLQQGGMTVVTPNATAIRAAAESAINTLFATKWTVTTWEEVLEE
jgi:TRAP-type C4-dicarboxylate transport system substrate-binding protein